MSHNRAAHDPSVAVRRRHLPSEAGEEKQKLDSAYERRAPSNELRNAAAVRWEAAWPVDQADQPSRERPIAIDTAAWLGSTTGRPTWRCRRSR